ncbi:MAG: hypothetical protein MJZ05_04580 [Fibrobacter sp.]|nr:hypothetical protein [Fibrobacter sp.]
MGEMPWEMAKAAIEKYAGRGGYAAGNVAGRSLREVIPSTMGEPLLYSHFNELLDLCKSLNVKVNLTTNGTFPGFWGTTEGMRKLLECCCDIKISTLASEQFDGWRANVEKLLNVRSTVENFAVGSAMENAVEFATTVSLQVTLHKENLMMIPEVIAWASAKGIDRIKWNRVVFLSTAPKELVEKFALSPERVAEIRNYVKGFVALGGKVKHEGNLFFGNGNRDDANSAPRVDPRCGFDDELWILPDGTEQHCPNPERRFGNGNAPEAQCCNCPMAR